MKHLWAILTIVFYSSFIIAQETIAVVDFDGKGVSDTDASALTDRLRTELYNSEHFKIVERGIMEEILNEQGFQQSGITSDEYFVEVGRLIGVEKIVGGSVNKVGNMYSVSAKIVSVETGEILKAVSYDHGGKLSDLMKTGMKDVALELVGQKRKVVPSIAIIPLNNKGEKEDDFYVYGISADLISDVSGAGLIRVASLRQIEELGDIPIEEIARNLFVRYVATGTLWKIGKVFQLSLELYDTEESTVVWSNRWQEAWENLPSIKGKLADNILSALNVSTVQEITKSFTSNPDAYEYYLKGNYRFNIRKNAEDVILARGLIRKAIELDDNLIEAKSLLGWTYVKMGEYDKALQIYSETLKQVEEIEGFQKTPSILYNIGSVYQQKGDFNKALEYVKRSIEIDEQLGKKQKVERSQYSLGRIYYNIDEYDKAKDSFTRSLKINEELEDLGMIGASLNYLGNISSQKYDMAKALEYNTHSLKIANKIGARPAIAWALNNLAYHFILIGEYDKVYDYLEPSLIIFKELGDKHGIPYVLNNLGIYYFNMGEYDKALGFFTESINMQKDIGTNLPTLVAFVEANTLLYLCYQKQGIPFDRKELEKFINDSGHYGSEMDFSYYFYQLLEDTTYLDNAYKKVQEKAESLEPSLREKFLSYPTPKSIVEDWKEVNP
jgi:tetratricopeptide (TPR) repeat protein